MITYTETTNGLSITVHNFFLEARSNVIMGEFCFVYFIHIQNNRDEAVQLLRRRWFIHDSKGKDEIVEGDGVVGEQPLIQPGMSYSYNSFCLLKSFAGYMEGSYTLQTADESLFEAIIPRFYLCADCN